MASRGFTLVEILVTTAIMGFLSLYILDSMTTQQKSHAVIDQVSELQQNARVVGELIERDLRHAGFMVPEAAAVCGIDNEDDFDSIWVSDAGAIEPGANLEANLAASLPAALTNIVAGQQTHALDRVILETDTPDPAYDTDADGSSDSDFMPGQSIIVADVANPERGSACGTIDDLNGLNIRFTILSNVLGAVPVPGNTPELVAVPAHRFWVDGNLNLFRNNLIVATGIEDLQFAYFFDEDGDGAVDAPEYFGDGIAARYFANARNGVDLREIRLNFVMRTPREDQENTMGEFQALANRNAVAGSDGFRRRPYVAQVTIRNIGGRIL